MSKSAAAPNIESLLSAGTVKAANKLQEIALGPDKLLSKSARKALYKLSLANIHPDAASKPAIAEEPTSPAEQIAFHVTNVAGNGNQMFIFIAEERFGGTPTFYSVLINHATGIKAFGANKVPHKEIAPGLETLKQSRGGMVAEVPIDYGRHLLAEAVANTKAARAMVPKGFAQLLARVGPPLSESSKSLIYNYFDPETILSDQTIGRDAGRLFDTEWFTGWLIDIETVAPWEEKYWEAVKTSLVLDHHQRLQRGDAVVDEAADTLLNSGELRVLRRRLEEEALVLELNGHTDAAKSALFHALSLNPETPAHEIEFARLLALRSIHLVMALKAEQEDEPVEESDDLEETETPGLIITG